MKYLSKNKNWKINEDYDINKILYLLIDRPNYIDDWNEIYWHNEKGEYYRNYNLPSFISINGYVYWHKNHKFHKEN